MIKRELGATGLLVTPLGVGGGALASMPEAFGYAVPEAQALATVHAVFRSPINFLDTAAAYGDGESERRIGLVLRDLGGLPRDFVLSTKADRNLQTGDYSGEQIKRSIEHSLQLLGLDHLQLVFLHDPEHTTFDAVIARGGPLEVLQRYQADGVIDHLGVAGGPVDLLGRYVDTRAFEAVITHNRYTLLNRSAEPLIARATELGVAVLNAAPYGSGILAKGPDAYPRYAYQEAAGPVVERARQMAELCRRDGVPLAAAALQFSLRDPRIVSTIVGVSRPERVAETVALAAHPIPDDLWPQLNQFAEWTDDPEGSRCAPSGRAPDAGGGDHRCRAGDRAGDCHAAGGGRLRDRAGGPEPRGARIFRERDGRARGEDSRDCSGPDVAGGSHTEHRAGPDDLGSSGRVCE
jgi:D-threo-aldose 1-dehydrogenase